MHDNAGRTASNEQSSVGHSGDKSKRAIHICRHHLVVGSKEHAVALENGVADGTAATCQNSKGETHRTKNP